MTWLLILIIVVVGLPVIMGAVGWLPECLDPECIREWVQKIGTWWSK